MIDPDALQVGDPPASQPAQRLRVLAGKRTGRGHRARGEPCQDAFAAHADPVGARAVVAVADGLGSRPLSQFGSQAACDAAVASLMAEAVWDEAALRRAFAAAWHAVQEAAAERGVAPLDLATTLQVAAVADGRLVAGMVGDGAIVCGEPAEVVLAAPTAGYANEVMPLTADWAQHIQVAERVGVGAEAPTPVLVFTDGLTRLLLVRTRAGWTPFAPFFDAFIPRLAEAGDGVVQEFLDGDQVDRSWDDDKCLAVIHRAA
jgi:hypothetical protein